MKQHVKRNIQPWLLELLGVFPAVELTGARQVGKSTLAAMAVEDLGREAIIFTLDDPEILNIARTDPRGFLAQGKDRVMVIDEFQRAPELVLPLKSSIDADRTPGRFIVTGSSRILGARSADSLAGRVIGCSLRGFSQGELIGVKEDFITRILNGIDPQAESCDLDRSDYVDLIARGSMPESQSLSSKMRNVWFDSYLERITSKDLQDIQRLPEPSRVITLLRELAAIQGSEVVVGKLANLVNIPATTASQYITLLRSIFLVDVIPPWTPNLLKREVGKSKMIISDCALGLYLTRTRPESLKDLIHGQAFGGFLEAFVAGELLRQQTWSETEWQLSHYRSPDGREIDLIIELEDSRIIALEIKAASTVSRQDIKHLDWLREKYGEKLIAGVVFNTDRTARLLGPRLYALPVASLWRQ